MNQEEILAAEKAQDDRQRSRNKGYLKMKERDRGWAKLTPYYGTAKEVIMTWGPEVKDVSKFVLKIDGKDVVFDAEEFRKSLRWV